MARIYYVGTWLKTALESTGERPVMSVPSWDFYRLPPAHSRMAMHKFNRLQIHLNDDQGWRLEIKQYARLTPHWR